MTTPGGRRSWLTCSGDLRWWLGWARPSLPDALRHPQPMAAQMHFERGAVGHLGFIFDLGGVDQRTARRARLTAPVPCPSFDGLFHGKSTVRNLGADLIGQTTVCHSPYLFLVGTRTSPFYANPGKQDTRVRSPSDGAGPRLPQHDCVDAAGAPGSGGRLAPGE